MPQERTYAKCIFAHGRDDHDLACNRRIAIDRVRNSNCGNADDLQADEAKAEHDYHFPRPVLVIANSDNLVSLSAIRLTNICDFSVRGGKGGDRKKTYNKPNQSSEDKGVQSR